MNHIPKNFKALAILATTLVSCFHKTPSHAQSQPDKIILVDRSEFHRKKFKSRYFGEGDWNGTLSMDIAYEPILRVRGEIEKKLYGGRLLNFLTSWEPKGEAHITTITPVEYQECMWSIERKIDILHMREIEKIALKNKIQYSDLTIEGLGYGAKQFLGSQRVDQTHFIIVSSSNLLNIRHEVYNKYLEQGGDKDCWSPTDFYPHITVGYTHKDIHYPDVVKNLQKSLDNRVKLEVRGLE